MAWDMSQGRWLDDFGMAPSAGRLPGGAPPRRAGSPLPRQPAFTSCQSPCTPRACWQLQPWPSWSGCCRCCREAGEGSRPRGFLRCAGSCTTICDDPQRKKAAHAGHAKPWLLQAARRLAARSAGSQPPGAGRAPARAEAAAVKARAVGGLGAAVVPGGERQVRHAQGDHAERADCAGPGRQADQRKRRHVWPAVALHSAAWNGIRTATRPRSWCTAAICVPAHLQW